MGAVISIAGNNGIFIDYKGMRIALDPRGTSSSDLTFISHAHFDHLSETSGKKVIASRETVLLARERGVEIADATEELEGFKLLDSGHILGSRSILIDNDILYTGDFSLRQRAFLNKCQEAECDTLIIESTFGRSHYRFPPIASILERVNTLISEYFSRGKPVVLMGYPLGKAQILSYLFSSWDPIYVHNSVERMNQVYEKLGVRFGNDFTSYDAAVDKGLLNKKPWVMISPLQNGRAAFASNLKKKYDAGLIAFSGWSIEPRYKYSLSVDYAFPLSDHCDFDDLVRYVSLCKPRKIYTVHGFASEFASHLRKIGYDADPLSRYQKSLKDFMKEIND